MLYKLIIVDDEQNIRNGLRENIPWGKLGFSVAGLFENGKQALHYIDRNRVDAVLTDIRMPVMDGLEFVEKLHQGKYPVKTVILSGYAEFEYAQEAIKYGVEAYVLKPVDWDALSLEFLKIKESLDRKYNVPEYDDQPVGYYDQIRNTVQDYIEENFRTATLESVAVKVSMSPNYLSKIFKRKMGIGFSEYLTEVKMRKAAEMLRGIEYKIYEVSFAVGYDNPKNFTRAFKQYSGKSPREFRENGE